MAIVKVDEDAHISTKFGTLIISEHDDGIWIDAPRGTGFIVKTVPQEESLYVEINEP
jgi:hypothetical protein